MFPLLRILCIEPLQSKIQDVCRNLYQAFDEANYASDPQMGRWIESDKKPTNIEMDQIAQITWNSWTNSLYMMGIVKDGASPNPQGNPGMIRSERLADASLLSGHLNFEKSTWDFHRYRRYVTGLPNQKVRQVIHNECKQLFEEARRVNSSF